MLFATPAPSHSETLPPGQPASAPLDDVLARLGPAGAGIDPTTTFQAIAAAITAAGQAGSSPEDINRAVTNALAAILLLPNGAEDIVYSDTFVNGNSAPVAGPGRTASAGDARMAALRGGLTAQAGDPDVVFYYVNGILNTQSQALASANLIASRLARHLQRSITVTQIYNASAAEPGLTMLDGCAAAAQIDPNAPAAGLVGAICRQANICATPGLLMQTAWDSVKDSFPQLILQKSLDPNFASNPVNTELERLVRANVAAGKKVVIVSHSQGTLFVRNVLGRLSDVSPGNVSGFYISPAFGSGDDLKTPSTRFVILKGDAMSVTGLSSSTPLEPAADQQGGPLDLHYIDTYLKEGTPSLQLFLDGVSELLRGMGAKGAVDSTLSRVADMQPVTWRQPRPQSAIVSEATNCDPAATVQPSVAASASVAPGAGTFIVTYSGFINGTIGPDWGTDANPRCHDIGPYFTVGGGGYGPDGHPYGWELQTVGVNGPGTHEGPNISATLANYDGAGYAWSAYRPKTGTLTINGDNVSGSFSVTMTPDRYGPTNSGEVSMSGTFRCATLEH